MRGQGARHPEATRRPATEDRQGQERYRFYKGEYDFKPGEFGAGTTVAAQR
jgi:hypothetical protein